MYVAALRARGHEDEAEARNILEDVVAARGVNPEPLEKLIDLAHRFVASYRREDGF